MTETEQWNQNNKKKGNVLDTAGMPTTWIKQAHLKALQKISSFDVELWNQHNDQRRKKETAQAYTKNATTSKWNN